MVSGYAHNPSNPDRQSEQPLLAVVLPLWLPNLFLELLPATFDGKGKNTFLDLQLGDAAYDVLQEVIGLSRLCKCRNDQEASK